MTTTDVFQSTGNPMTSSTYKPEEEGLEGRGLDVEAAGHRTIALEVQEDLGLGDTTAIDEVVLSRTEAAAEKKAQRSRER